MNGTTKVLIADGPQPVYKPCIRWLIRQDEEPVLAIEEACFLWDSWTQQELRSILCRRDAIGQVLEVGERVLGYMVYLLQPDSLELIRLAVDPLFWGRGGGRLLVEKLATKLSSFRRRSIGVTVPETEVRAQLFFRALGFAAESVVRGRDGEDGVRMRYHLEVGGCAGCGAKFYTLDAAHDHECPCDEG
jgi:ribosomal-protein-alanine N-acetyltransferase